MVTAARPDENEGTGGVRVVIADDDLLVREGVASLLHRNGYEVVGQAGDGDDLLSLVRRHKPDLAIVDIRMPPTHSTEGLDAARTIRAELPDVAILVLSAYVDINHAMELLRSGTRSGYLLKRRVTDVDEFIDTLQRLVRGGSVVDPTLISELVGARRVHDPLEELSQREREVLALMAEGRSNVGHRTAAVGQRANRREARTEHPGQAADCGGRPTTTGGCSRW